MKPIGYSGRLRLAIDDAQVTVRDLASQIGVTTQAVYKVLRGQSHSLQAAHHLRAAKFLKVEPRWLADGVGPRIAGGPVALRDNPEYPAVGKVRFVSDTNQQRGYRVEKIDGDANPVVFHLGWYTQRGLNPSRLIAAEIGDRGMEPTLHPGDTVLINVDDTEAHDASVFAVWHDDAMLVRRLLRDRGQWWLTCDNQDSLRHPRREVAQSTVIIGRVVHRQSDHL